MGNKNKNKQKVNFTKLKELMDTFGLIIFSIIFGAMFVVLIISTIRDWSEKWQIFFVYTILVLSIFAAIYPLIKKEKTTVPERIVVTGCFAILIMSVVIFASVAKDNYKEPVIQIAAATTGGLLTLYGVGLTIKSNRLEKERKDIEKAKPNVFPISDQVWDQLPEDSKLERDIIINTDLTDLSKASRTDACYSIAPMYLENSDLSMCTFKGIGINDKHFIVFHFDNVMLKESINCFFVDYSFKFDEEIESIQLVLGDMYGNTYSCYVSFDVDDSRKRKNKPIYILGVQKMKLMDTNKHDVFEKLK